MPLFEFRCVSCKRRFTKLLGMTADSAPPVCPRCGSGDVKKLISRFSRVRSEDQVLDSLEDAAMSSDTGDPRNARKWMKEVGSQLADDGEDDVGEMMEEAEREMFDGASCGDSCEAEDLD